MDINFTPKIGTRFSLHGSNFEIAFAEHDLIRYASSAGGKPHQITFEQFDALKRAGKIQVDYVADNEVTQKNISHVIYRHRYVEAALVELIHPTSLKGLRAVINRVSNEINDLTPPTPRAVARWVKKTRQSGTNGLINRQNTGNKNLRFSPEIEYLINEGISKIYLTQERRSAGDVCGYVIGRAIEIGLCNRSGEEIQFPTARTIQRRIKQLDPYVVTRAKKGPLAAERMARASGRKVISEAVMALVQIDTHYLDVHVIDESTGDVIGRPFLTCVMDIATRAIVGIHICMYPPSATTALGALKDMLSRANRGLPGGIPVRIVPDNGVEFANTSFARICEFLAVTISPAQIRDPDGKAHIESLFRTLTHGIVQKLPGTTFSNPTELGDYDSLKKSVFTIDQIRSFIEEWINEIYHKTIHTKTGRAPICFWEEKTKNIAPISLSEDEVNALARRPETRSINKGLIQYDYIEYFSHALATLEAQGHTNVTILIDDLNLNSILVQHPEDKATLILAESNDPEYTTGLTIYEHQEAKKIRKEMTKSDISKLGKLSFALSRWKLLERVQEQAIKMKRWIKKLTNGESRNVYTQRKISEINNSISPPTQDSKPGKQVASPAPAIEVISLSESNKPCIKNENYNSFKSIELE
ncbi:DDE-type integrase/transposase/recombinase [Cellvibrio sp. pealriver]|uniref:DDE-type integrase/transposase/recombinase n=1 Tax=Cellvibrio sp. pealriver TaxID=1622269 RepID=UPI0009E589E3|nr:DDE-type integrase/transposase/recombinase [Cellvibrio sp. pealriver]